MFVSEKRDFRLGDILFWRDSRRDSRHDSRHDLVAIFVAILVAILDGQVGFSSRMATVVGSGDCVWTVFGLRLDFCLV